MNYKIGLYRILGNDLPPRHGEDQTRKNVEFILEHEHDYLDTKRIWCLNRIWNPDKLRVLKEMIESKGDERFEIPFVISEYRKFPDAKSRIHYATNVNQARNACIDHGKAEVFDITLLLDGSAYLPRDGYYPWEDLVYTYPPTLEAVYGLPVARAESFEEILSIDYQVQVKERILVGDRYITGMRENYLAITNNCDIRFNENLTYGRVDKVEFMWRMGMRGPWDHWDPAIRRQATQPDRLSKYCGTVKAKGYAIRLPTHGEEGCADIKVRGRARVKGLENLIRTLDALPD